MGAARAIGGVGLAVVSGCLGGSSIRSTGITIIEDTASFVVVDEVVSDPNDSLTDPEFDAYTMRLAWSPQAGGALWLADIDPVTGAIVPPDGRGEFVDDGVGPHATYANGPEWIVWDGGSGVLYTKRRGGADWVHLAVPDPITGTWQYKAIVRGGGPRGSIAPADTDPHLTFDQDDAIHWARLDMTDEGQLSPERQRYQTWWIEDDPRVVWSGPSPDRTAQMMHTDVVTGVTTQLTTGSDRHHVDGNLWFSPLRGEEMLFALRLDGRQLPQEIVVFASRAGIWTPIHWIPVGDLTSFRRFVISPELFVFQGKSYVTFLLSTRPTNAENGYAQVWLAGLEPENTLLRQVSDDRMMIRKDPEVVVTSDRVWIYYTEVDDQGDRIVHRCESGL